MRGQHVKWFAAQNEFHDLPHPGLLPRGEGTAIARGLIYEQTSGISRRELFKVKETADDSPSPRGE